MTVHLDIESYSETNLTEVGLFKYANCLTTETMLLSYKVDDGPVICLDLANGDKVPPILIKKLRDPGVIKKAWNAFFEFEMLNRLIGGLEFVNWKCTMVKAAYNGYPLKLDSAAKALKMDKGKMQGGKDLIKYFCAPCKPTKRNGMRTRNLPCHEPDKWQDFTEYNIRDVDVEYEIDKILKSLPDREQEIYEADHSINAAGVHIDLKLVNSIIKAYADYETKLVDRMREITGIDNPNSPVQIKKWLQSVSPDLDFTTLKAEALEQLLQEPSLPATATEVLKIRKGLSLSSIKKYATMLQMADASGCIRGLLQCYGAIRTGRWAGRGVQVHNLARQKSKLAELDNARKAVKSGFTFTQLDLLYGDVSKLFKELLRTAFIPKPGSTFFIADYSSIEAVVLAFLAGEQWKIDVFKGHGKIYEATAAKMFGLNINEIGEDSEERFKGKISELSLGYQGSVGALVNMGALKMGLTEEELPDLVQIWRHANPKIVKLWRRSQNAFVAAFQNPGKIIKFCNGLLTVRLTKNRLEMGLPSGRCLHYPGAHLRPGKYEDCIAYLGPNQVSKVWGPQQLYGGKIVENFVQAIARDVLAEAILKLSPTFDVALHVHDEIAFQLSKEHTNAINYDLIEKTMTAPPDWLPGLPLKVKAFSSPFYRKN